MVSVCTGAFALAAAGLLDGRKATTHWQNAAELAARHPNIDVDPDVLYVDDGAVATSAGVAAGIDLCLHVVRRDHGEQAAARIARRMVVAPHRDGGQAQFLQRPLPAAGDGLASTCAWALDRLTEPLTIAELARHAGWAPRTFARRFVAETGTSPLRWLTAQRLLEARRLLETTDLPIDQVAARSGLGTAANLRLHLARDTATTPTAYRHAYRGR
jgi:AraC family transcriptional activator FtrA